MNPLGPARLLLRVYAAAFALVIGAVGYWQVARGPELATNPHNRRYWQNLRSMHRGTILSADGQELAVSEPVKAADGKPRRRPEYDRRYPLGDLFAHVVGYSDWKIKESGIEMALNRQLLALDSPPPAPDSLQGLIWQSLVPPERRGNDVTLTIDSQLQRLAASLLGHRNGAIVALDVRTGAVLAMVDWPRFDPNRLLDGDQGAKLWAAMQKDQETPLLARAYQGLYPPGSVFKVMTAAAALQAGVVQTGDRFVCRGVKKYRGTDSFTVYCHVRSGHGDISFADGLAKSCNIVFADTALRLGAGPWAAAVRAAGLDQRPELFYPGVDTAGVVGHGRLPKEPMARATLANSGYGQGEVVVTPLWIAMLGQAVANGGVMLEPRLVKSVTSPGGQARYTLQPSAGRAAMSAATAATVLKLMRGVVQPGGTASGLRTGGMDVAAKTGTAENPQGEPHSWFLALAPAEAPRVAVAAVVEHGGYGIEAAGPAALKVLRQALDRAP